MIQPFPSFISGGTPRTPAYLNTEYTQNLYYESAGQNNNRNAGVLLSTPGLQTKSYLTFPETGPVLALGTVSQVPAFGSGYVTQPTTYAAVSRGFGDWIALYRINNDLTTPTLIGNLPWQGFDLLRIIPGNQALFVINTTNPSPYGFYYYYQIGSGGVMVPAGGTAPTGFAFSVGPNWKTPVDGDYVDGYWIFAQAVTENWFISDVQQPIFSNALAFTAELDLPDTMAGIRAVGGRVWVFGKQRMVAWYNSGAAIFPFTRDNSSRIDVGLVSANSLVKLENTLFWLGRDPKGAVRAFVLDGYTPTPISTHAEEQIWQSYASVDLALAWAYQEEGHSFYVLSFPANNATFAYDRSENRWHRRSSLNGATGLQEYHATASITYNPLLGGQIVGDRGQSRCYVQSRSILTDFGLAITRRRTSPHLYGGGPRNGYSRFLLDANTQLATLAYSNDYGVTYSTPRAPDIVGSDRAEWLRLGSARTDRVFDLSITDTTKPVVVAGASLDIEAGTA